VTSPTHLRHVTGWLADLANHTAGTAALVDAKEKISSMAATLADVFPDQACFTRESLVAIATQNGFFPGFGTLHVQLTEWWSKHRPVKYAVPSDLASASIPNFDRVNVEIWLTHRAANDLPADGMHGRLAVIRRHAPAGFEWLVRNDLFAAEIAVRHGWSEEATPEAIAREVKRDWEDPEIVGSTARRYAGDKRALGLLRGLVAKWAPENLDLIAEDIAAPAPPETQTQATVQPRHLSPEQLRAAHDAIPGGSARAAQLRAPTPPAAEADQPWLPSDAAMS
jgi:hypothetical protein